MINTTLKADRVYGQRTRRHILNNAAVGAFAVMLVAVVLFQTAVSRRFERQPAAAIPNLQTVLPTQLPGWIIREMPLGLTEAASDFTEKMLNFDSYVYRQFERDGLRVSVYVAYWGRGRMPTQLVASHTPDRCWTEAGWSCDAITHNFGYFVNGRHLIPSERRIFSDKRMGTIDVQYWHLVDGCPYDFGKRFNDVPSPWRWWRDATVQMFHLPPEQYFIRIHSNRSFEELHKDMGFARIVAGLPIYSTMQPGVDEKGVFVR